MINVLDSILFGPFLQEPDTHKVLDMLYAICLTCNVESIPYKGD
jgi:hypothetical protein